ncbi:MULTISPECIES: hypothetical protein [unclassified Lentimonas]|nr:MULTISPECIES: hypothetical protein [unclassified Lentimonas]
MVRRQARPLQPTNHTIAIHDKKSIEGNINDEAHSPRGANTVPHP